MEADETVAGGTLPVIALADNEAGIVYADIAELWGGLQRLNEALKALEAASMLGKAAKAEGAINTARDLMAKNVAVTHKLFAEMERMDLRLQRIESIGVIQNG